jgi:hypothetical protein
MPSNKKEDGRNWKCSSVVEYLPSICCTKYSKKVKMDKNKINEIQKGGWVKRYWSLNKELKG